jgi:hypothetical protein
MRDDARLGLWKVVEYRYGDYDLRFGGLEEE